MKQLLSALDKCFEDHKIRKLNKGLLNTECLVALSTVYRKITFRGWHTLGFEGNEEDNYEIWRERHTKQGKSIWEEEIFQEEETTYENLLR